MKILADKNQHKGKHILKHNQLQELGYEVDESYRLPCGDYVLVNEKIQTMLDAKAKRGIEPKMLDFMGTYDVVVDTKSGLQELVGDICSSDHGRFHDSIVLAKNNGIRYIVLIEDDVINSIDQVFRWQNPRYKRYTYVKYQREHYGKYLDVKLPSKPPTNGPQLAKAMLTIKAKYDVEFVFAKKSETGKRIIELLTEGNRSNEERTAE